MSDSWIMKGAARDDPNRLRSADELVEWVLQTGFVPLFANEVPGFSVEERVLPEYWWTGDAQRDPWQWREIIATRRRVAYGKFFDGRAGFISPEWLPVFANARRNGYDFDGKWQSGAASLRERAIMECFMNVESADDPEFNGEAILSTDLKRRAGFGKGGEKNYSGVLTGLQMQLYLVIADFRRRVSRSGSAYGMPVSVLMAPESIWGYRLMSSAYEEEPCASWDRIFRSVSRRFHAREESIIRLIGRRPAS